MFKQVSKSLEDIAKGRFRSGESARNAYECHGRSPWFGNSPQNGACSASFTNWQYSQGQQPYEDYGDEEI